MLSVRKTKRIFLISRCAWTMFNFRAGLIRALVAAGYDVVTAGAADEYAERVRSLGVEFISLPVSFRALNPAGDMKLYFEIARLMRRLRPDVVHNFTIKPVVFGSLAEQGAGCSRIVNTVTGLGYAFTGRRPFLRRGVETLYRRALHRSHHTFFQNATDFDYFVSHGLVNPEAASIVAGSGVDLVRFARAPMPGSELPVSFLMVARLLKDKGVNEYLEASSSVKSRVGDGVSFALLGRIDARNPSAVSESVVSSWEAGGIGVWMGHTHDVVPYLERTHVAVLPSYREGMPRSLLEAGAVGRPAIATDVPGCRDVVVHERTGLLVPARDAGRLEQAMIRLIEHPEMIAEMGEAARIRVAERFSEESVIRATLDRYFE